MTVFVLDNSVVMRWCFDAGLHARADGILALLLTPGAAAIVPALWLYEVLSVLTRAETQGALTSVKASEFLHALDALPVVVDDRSIERVFSEVRTIALAFRLTSYDAAYLEIAIRRQIPIATFDQHLAQASRRAGVQVL